MRCGCRRYASRDLAKSWSPQHLALAQHDLRHACLANSDHPHRLFWRVPTPRKHDSLDFRDAGSRICDVCMEFSTNHRVVVDVWSLLCGSHCVDLGLSFQVGQELELRDFPSAAGDEPYPSCHFLVGTLAIGQRLYD